MTTESEHRHMHHGVGRSVVSSDTDASAAADAHDSHADHNDMEGVFRRRSGSLVLAIPVLILSPMVRGFAGQGMAPLFAGEEWVAFALSTAYRG